MADLDGYCLKKVVGGLVPADFHSEDAINSIPVGGEVLVTLRRARNPKFHRWFFALLRKVIDNSPERWKNEEDLLFALKIAVGHHEQSIDLTGQPILLPKSINFASMSEIDFKTFVTRCLDEIHLNLGIDPDLLMQEVEAEQGKL